MRDGVVKMAMKTPGDESNWFLSRPDDLYGDLF